MKVLALYRGVWVSRSLLRRQHQQVLFDKDENLLGAKKIIAHDDGFLVTANQGIEISFCPEGFVMLEVMKPKKWREQLATMHEYCVGTLDPVLEQVVHQDDPLPRLVSRESHRYATVIVLEKATVEDIEKVGKDMGFVLRQTASDRSFELWQSGSLLVINRKTIKIASIEAFVREYLLIRDLAEHAEYYAHLQAQVWEEVHDPEALLEQNLDTYEVLGHYVRTRLEHIANTLEARSDIWGDGKATGKKLFEVLQAEYQKVATAISQAYPDWELVAGALGSFQQALVRTQARRQVWLLEVLNACVATGLVVVVTVIIPVPQPVGWLASIWYVLVGVMIWWFWYSLLSSRVR